MEMNLMAKPVVQFTNGRCHFDWETKPDLLDPSKLLKNTKIAPQIKNKCKNEEKYPKHFVKKIKKCHLG